MIKALELAEIKQHNNGVSVRLSFGFFAGDSHNKKLPGCSWQLNKI